MAQGKRIKDPVKPGDRHGRLKVIEKDHMESGVTYWLCQCDCGNTKVVKASYLAWDQTRSCGCLYEDTRGEQKRLPNGEAAFNRLYKQYRCGARSRGHSFELTKDQFRELTQESCRYCGRLPSQVIKSGYDTGDFTYNGVDRVDNTKGYFKGNVFACCGLCNHMKSDIDPLVFFEQVKRIYGHFISPPSPFNQTKEE